MSPHSICETSRLLPPSATQDEPSSKPCGGQAPTSRRFTIALQYLMVFLVLEISLMLSDTPLNPIQEGIICRKYYPVPASAASVDPRCKTELVQSELSFLKGWQLTFSLLPGMITAGPYGMAAEKYGHRFILALSTLGLVLSQASYILICSFPDIFDLRLIWLGSALSIIGGGAFVNAAMMYTIAADFSTGEERSTVFFYISAVALVGRLVGSPLTYAAMAHGNWFAVYTGFAFATAATLATFFLPGTDCIRDPKCRDEHISSPDETSSGLGLKDHILSAPKEMISMIRTMFWENKQLGLLLSTFLFTAIGKSLPLILMQYMTKRFHWTWAEANLLNPINASVQAVEFTVILPFISQVLMRSLGLTPILKDLWLARTGLLALTAGAFGMGLANNSVALVIGLVVYSLGFGSDPAMRGLLVTMAEGRPTSVLFTTMSVLEGAGLLISGPLLAATFKIGMEWEGVWIGLPCITAGCFVACATAVAFGARAEGKAGRGLDDLI